MEKQTNYYSNYISDEIRDENFNIRERERVKDEKQKRLEELGAILDQEDIQNREELEKEKLELEEELKDYDEETLSRVKENIAKMDIEIEKFETGIDNLEKENEKFVEQINAIKTQIQTMEEQLNSLDKEKDQNTYTRIESTISGLNGLLEKITSQLESNVQYIKKAKKILSVYLKMRKDIAKKYNIELYNKEKKEEKGPEKSKEEKPEEEKTSDEKKEQKPEENKSRDNNTQNYKSGGSNVIYTVPNKVNDKENKEQDKQDKSENNKEKVEELYSKLRNGSLTKDDEDKIAELLSDSSKYKEMGITNRIAKKFMKELTNTIGEDEAKKELFEKAKAGYSEFDKERKRTSKWEKVKNKLRWFFLGEDAMMALPASNEKEIKNIEQEQMETPEIDDEINNVKEVDLTKSKMPGLAEVWPPEDIINNDVKDINLKEGAKSQEKGIGKDFVNISEVNLKDTHKEVETGPGEDFVTITDLNKNTEIHTDR